LTALQPVRGTHDLLPEDCRRHRRVVETFREIVERYGFGEIATPIFEFTEVFRRTLGETSDVVTKEMYTFSDRGGDEITLRPEYTASVARAFISHGLKDRLPLKLYGHGPMFRYERPQKGRQRQFHQLDIEVLGAAEPLADIEVIAVGADLLAALGVADKVRLEINTLGDPESRAHYRERLVAYFATHRDRLSPDSRLRLTRNPLRILDSKDEGDRALITGAPSMAESLTPASAAFFARVREGLAALGIAHVVNPRLVRGLDYYTHTAFEFVTEALGAQGAVIAGGRYDGLIEAMGGPPTPGIGWAAGIERLVLLSGVTPPAKRPIAVVPVSPADEGVALVLTQRLRHAGFTVALGYRGNVSRRLKRANRLGAAAALVIGESERARAAVTLRDLDSGDQAEVPEAELEDRLVPYR